MESNNSQNVSQETQEAQTQSTTETQEGGAQEGAKLTIVEEAQAAAKENRMILEEMKAERIKLEELRAKEALGGVTEGRPVDNGKEETDKEYRARINKELSEGKYDGKSG